MKIKKKFYNEDCIEGCKTHIKDNSIDLIITDPPYGINGDKLHKHYNRKENFVLDGYIEIPAKQYADFSIKWISEAERVLRPGGSLYVVSGYTNLIDILNALKQTKLIEVNHIIWKYNFGVYTKKKYISSHYHILYYTKPGGKVTFNTHCRYGADEKNDKNRSLNYSDREDVWVINREYKPGKIKNKNELPSQLLIKLIQYSSNKNDLVCDLFLGSFSTAKIAIGLNRSAIGFELSKTAFEYQIDEIDKIQTGYLIPSLRQPNESINVNQGKPWNEEDKKLLRDRYSDLINKKMTKKYAIGILSEEFGRGRWSLLKLLDRMNGEIVLKESQMDFTDKMLEK